MKTKNEQLEYMQRCRARAAREDLQAHPLPIGPQAWHSYAVNSGTHAGKHYAVSAWLGHRELRIVCSCQAGEWRDGISIPCKHAAVVAEVLLETHVASVTNEGEWTVIAPILFNTV